METAHVQECSFHSPSLGREMSYSIVLPGGYEESNARFPVLYLLHGWNGDHKNWCTLTNLLMYAARYPLIVVTPDAANSWYVNSATVATDRFYDYISCDLISEVDQRYRTMASGNSRAIAGLSMGGYGSLLLMLKQPGMFAMAGSISGAFDGPSGVEKVLPHLQESTDIAYGQKGSDTRRDNNIFSLLEDVRPTGSPYIYLHCGTRDALLPSNRKLAAELSARNIPYEYHELPGEHSWDFWDAALPALLTVVAKQIID